MCIWWLGWQRGRAGRAVAAKQPLPSCTTLHAAAAPVCGCVPRLLPESEHASPRCHPTVHRRDEEEAARALQGMQGRYYAGKPIVVEFSPVTGEWACGCCGRHALSKQRVACPAQAAGLLPHFCG